MPPRERSCAYCRRRYVHPDPDRNFCRWRCKARRGIDFDTERKILRAYDADMSAESLTNVAKNLGVPRPLVVAVIAESVRFRPD